MISTAEAVANALLETSRTSNCNDPITNLKLQKLLYYSQAWHLALYEEPLFEEPIEAWVHGPVVPSIFQRFRSYKWSPITEQVSPTKDEYLSDHVAEIFSIYGKFKATQLERLTHAEDPWLKARAGLEPDESSHAIISHESMRSYYSSKLVVNA